MRVPRIKFVWRGAREMRARWYLGLFRFYDRVAGRRDAELAVSVRGLLWWTGGVLALSVWMRTQFGEKMEREPEKNRANTPAAEVPMKLESLEQWFFSRLDEALREKRWEDAGELIDSARQMRPPLAWIETRDAELRLAQTRIGHERGSMTEMLAAARLYLNGSNERSAKMLEVARAIYSSDRSHAIELAKEVRRKSPDYPPVRRLLAEWQPRK